MQTVELYKVHWSKLKERSNDITPVQSLKFLLSLNCVWEGREEFWAQIWSQITWAFISLLAYHKKGKLKWTETLLLFFFLDRRLLSDENFKNEN